VLLFVASNFAGAIPVVFETITETDIAIFIDLAFIPIGGTRTLASLSKVGEVVVR